MNKKDKEFFKKIEQLSFIEKIKLYINKNRLAALKNAIKKNKYGFSINKLRELTHNLDSIVIESTEIYNRCWHLYDDSRLISLCPVCGKQNKFLDLVKGYAKNCGKKKCQNRYTIIQRDKSMMNKFGVTNVSQLDYVKKKRTETFIKRYGVENPYQAKFVKEKIKETNLEKYGVENVSQNKEIQEKRIESFKDNIDQWRKSFKKTSNERFGTDYPWQSEDIRKKVQKIFDEKYDGHPLRKKEFMDKLKATNMKRYGMEFLLMDNEWKKKKMLEKYGVEHPMYLEETKKKIQETCLKNYGETSHMKNADFYDRFIKNLFKTKDYELPSGRIVQVQGYEPLALDGLFEAGYEEIDIIVDNKDIENFIGKVIYKTNDGKSHRYYPDIYIVSENRVIEVKSEYTFRKNKEINLLKMQAVLDMGIEFEFKIL